MTKVNQLFEIESFDLGDDQIEVVAFKGKKETTITVNRERFEKWLRHNDKLDWVYDYRDNTGDHVQDTGVMSLEDYWSVDISYQSKRQDLYDFIITKMAYCASFFDVQTPLQNILSAFKKSA